MFSVKSSGNSTLFGNAGSTRVSPECPWVARKYRKCSDELGFKQYWNLFFWPPPFAKKLIQARIGQCEVPSNSDLNIDATSSNLTAPSSSQWTDSSCRRNLIINFDTSKQPWLKIHGPISIHFRSLYGIDTEDNVKVGVGRGLALSPRLATGISSNVSVTIHDTNPRTSSVTKQRFDLDLRTVTSLLVTDRHLQDWTDLRVSTDPPFHLGWLITSRQSVLSTWSHQFVKCIIVKCNEELSFSHLRNQHWSKVWSISLVQEDLRSSAHIHTTSFLVLRHQSEEFDQLMEILSVWPKIRDPQRSGSPRTFWASGQFSTQIRCCSVDTELIDGNNCS